MTDWTKIRTSFDEYMEVIPKKSTTKTLEDKVSFRCSPVNGLLEMIDHAAEKSRRDRSDWIRQSLYIVALAELAGVNVQDILRRYVR